MGIENNKSMFVLRMVRVIERVVPNTKCLKIEKSSEALRVVKCSPDLEIHLVFQEDFCDIKLTHGTLTMEHWLTIVEQQQRLLHFTS